MRLELHRPTVSVVVIGRNEGDRLVRCLASVNAMRQPAGGVEKIYVDSASTDGSCERAAAMGVRVVRIAPARPCAAAARNAGWRAARGRLVLFLDGDTVLDPDFVVGSMPAFDDPKVAIAWGHRREIAPRASIYQRVLDLDWVYRPGRTAYCGGDALVRRDVLVATGGFDDALIAGEEPDLCRRIRARGWEIEHLDRPMTLHDLAMTRWNQYWRRAQRAGHAYAEVAERSSGSATPLWGDVARANERHVAVLAGILVTGLAAALALRSPLPLAAALAALAGLCVRTALRESWKTNDPVTLLLYGMHSHLQQIPILAGQVAYRRDRRRGRERGLIDYKESRP